jgi:hypothetical protein
MSRQVIQSPIEQGADEEIAYTVTTTPWGSDPSDVVVKAYNLSAGYTDVSQDVLTGNPSVNGDVITTPVVGTLTIEIKFTVGGNIMECYCEIRTTQ